MFNRIQFNSLEGESDECACGEEYAKAVWEFLLTNHIKTSPSTDFGSLVKEIREKLEKEKSRILLE